ncbi:MAG: hypothetical protein ACI3X1_06400 [Eubacteriales bacterium]
MKKKVFFLISVLLFSLILSSCAEKSLVSCRDILGELKDAEIGLPAGKTYDLKAGEGEDEFLPERLLSALFGEGATPPVRCGWLDAALFLPTSSHPCEFAVILCNSDDTATDTARLLCRRLDSIRTLKQNGEYSALLDNARVTVIRNYVLLIISSDADNAVKTAARKVEK